MCALIVDQRVLEDLISSDMPDIFDHLTVNDITVPSFSVAWFLCCFVNSPLSVEDVLPLWDLLFVYGDVVLFQFSLGLFSHFKRQILSKGTQADLLTYLLHEISEEMPEVYVLLDGMDYSSLWRRVCCLREYHQHAFLHSRYFPPSLLNGNEKFSFTDAEIEQLWSDFVRPFAWEIMLHASIPTDVAFQRAIAPFVFPDSRREWRDHGLISGLVHRLFEVLDTNHTQRIDFNEFIAGVFLFCRAPQDQKLLFAFHFCDTKRDGVIDLDEFADMIRMLEETYNGRPSAEKNAGKFRDLVCESQNGLRDPKNGQVEGMLSYQDFCQFALTHPLICKFFRLL